ncbi:hypothetical protein EV714DRAFT_250925 [Schizophyllum commune]
MAGRYAPIPTSTDAERELDDAFGPDDDGDHHETAPLTGRRQSADHYDDRQYDDRQHGGEQATSALAGGYDFDREYEYDRPPPGSPPAPSARALPNDYGNTNGEIPTAPAQPTPPRPRIGILRRAMGAILPTHYAPLPQTEVVPAHAVGGGLQNDGVFANVTAKPDRGQLVRATNGETYVMPEDAQKDTPPSYVEAQADAVPTYYETTVHAAPVDPNADILVDDLPPGSLWIFLINVFISFFFQVVGFLLTYLLHTTHAAKFGSRAGLGLTLIQFGLYSRGISNGENPPRDPVDALFGWTMGGMNDTMMMGNGTYGGEGMGMYGGNAEDSNSIATPSMDSPSDSYTAEPDNSETHDWIAFILMSAGWFILFTSVVGYWRVKRWERAIRASTMLAPDANTPRTSNITAQLFGLNPRSSLGRRSTTSRSSLSRNSLSRTAQPVTPAALARDREIRRNLEAVFGIVAEDEAEAERERQRAEAERRVQRDENGNVIVLPARETLEEQRLTRDLQAAGLL